MEKKTSRYESYIDRLERKAGIHFQPKDDGKGSLETVVVH